MRRGRKGCRTATSATSDPVWRDRVVGVDLAALLGAPAPFLVRIVFRRALELAVADIDLVAAELGVVRQPRPRHWVVIVAHAQNAAEAHDGIGDLAGGLLQHDALDLADL